MDYDQEGHMENTADPSPLSLQSFTNVSSFGIQRLGAKTINSQSDCCYLVTDDGGNKYPVCVICVFADGSLNGVEPDSLQLLFHAKSVTSAADRSTHVWAALDSITGYQNPLPPCNLMDIGCVNDYEIHDSTGQRVCGIEKHGTNNSLVFSDSETRKRSLAEVNFSPTKPHQKLVIGTEKSFDSMFKVLGIFVAVRRYDDIIVDTHQPRAYTLDSKGIRYMLADYLNSLEKTITNQPQAGDYQPSADVYQPQPNTSQPLVQPSQQTPRRAPLPRQMDSSVISRLSRIKITKECSTNNDDLFSLRDSVTGKAVLVICCSFAPTEKVAVLSPDGRDTLVYFEPIFDYRKPCTVRLEDSQIGVLQKYSLVRTNNSNENMWAKASLVTEQQDLDIQMFSFYSAADYKSMWAKVWRGKDGETAAQFYTGEMSREQRTLIIAYAMRIAYSSHGGGGHSVPMVRSMQDAISSIKDRYVPW